MIHTIDTLCHLIFLMLAGHALCDRPLQGDEISRGKNPTWNTVRSSRMQYLAVHGLIHGGAVALVTGLWWLGAAETIAHCTIDNAKVWKRISHSTDQVLHILCKVIWAVIAISV